MMYKLPIDENYILPGLFNFQYSLFISISIHHKIVSILFNDSF